MTSTMTSISTLTAPAGRAIAVGLTIAGLSIGLLGAGATSASARGDDDDRVIRTGSCSTNADWKLKVKTDDGRLEVEGEIDSDAAVAHRAVVTQRPAPPPPRAAARSRSSARWSTSQAPTPWCSAPCGTARCAGVWSTTDLTGGRPACVG